MTVTACLRTAGAIALAALASVPHSRLAGQTDANQLVPPAAFKDLKWRSVGATRGGRVTAYSGVRQQPHTFYFGGVGGGVWKTDDAGITWAPVSDGQITTTGSIGSIDVAPSNPNHVWVGTGSAAIRSNVIIGRGVYKSTDAGGTWQFMGLKDSGQIGGIKVHPFNTNTVWLAALGSPFGPNDERGIFKTTDGGKTWKNTLFVNNETGGRDIEVDHQNPDILYAAMYRGFRKGWDIISGGPATEGGIYKSIDGGETWKKISAGLPSKLIGKIDIDIARSNPKVLYAMVEAPGNEGGLFRSNDAGESWTLVNSQQRLRARPFYFHYVTVNPLNENEVWVNELGLHKSIDGGKTFTSVETPHGDNHGMWFNPDNPNIILQVNDGGANVSLNGGRSWSSILNQPTAEYYMVAVDEQYPYRLYMPQQDNSTLIIPSIPPVSWGFEHPAQAWQQASGCETGQIWPKKNGLVVWGACKGEVGRYNTVTGQEKHYWVYPQNRYGHDPDEIKYRFPRQTVVYVSPHDERVIYQASHVLHRSMDEGISWDIVSPDLTAKEPQYQIVSGNPITRDVTGEEVYSTIYSMIESRLERGVIWIGANDGPVSVTRDNGKTWKNVTPKDLVGARIQTVEDSPHMKGRAYIAGYRFMREHDLRPYIYRTDNYGESWTLLTDGMNGIPIDHPTRVIREDPRQPGLLYAGGEFGFFVSFNAGKNWQPLQQNLPTTPVTDIKVHRNDLVISTMGRSAWIMDNITPLQQLAAIVNGTPKTTAGLGFSDLEREQALPDVALFQPRETIRYRSSTAPLTRAEPEYPAQFAHFDLYFASAPGADTRLEVMDAGGVALRTWNVAPPRSAGPAEQGMRGPFGGRGGGGSTSIRAEAGMQRISWDLRYPGSWTAGTPAGGPGGPMVPPGKYSVRLTSGSQTITRTFDLKSDPRVAADGVTDAAIAEQVKFQLQVRDAISDARKLQQSIEQAMQKAGLKPQLDPGAVGSSPSNTKYDHPLRALYARVVTTPGIYTQGMLIDQLNNIQRMVTQADQRIGRDAHERYADLIKEMQAIEAQLKKLGSN
jgi:photosystem II stability/assembly factor-like uncharacterized protein